MIDNALINMKSRQDVFLNVKAFSLTKEAKMLNYEEKRFLKKTKRDGIRNGMMLEKSEVEDLQSIKKEMSELGIDFHKCLNEDKSYFLADVTDLSGVPQDIINSIAKDKNGRYKITALFHYSQVIRNGKNPKTRLKMEKIYRSRCVKENTARLEKLISLRQKEASLLGTIVKKLLDLLHLQFYRIPNTCSFCT